MKTLISVLAWCVACGSSPGVELDGGAGDGGTGDGAPTDAPPTLGCGQPGAATGMFSGTIQVGGVERSYLRVVPATYDPARSYPLVFAWHGRTGSAAGARSYFRIEAAAGDNAIIVYPQGLPVSATPGDTGWELTASGRDVALFDALAAELAATYCIGPTYSMGHSFGGYMSNALACYRGGSAPGQVRAIAPVAGGGPFGPCTGGPVSALIVHGTADSVVPFDQGVGSRDTWTGRASCAATTTAITPAPCVAYDGCTAGLDVRWCAHAEAANGGHGWPSFVAAAAWQLFGDS